MECKSRRRSNSWSRRTLSSSAIRARPHAETTRRLRRSFGMRLFASFLAVLLLGASPAPSPLAISIQNGQLAGPGARVLGDAAAGAHFVLLGEDHGTSEIAAFADAFFASLVPLGYHTIAVETGPILTERLRAWVAAPDGRAQYAAFEKTTAERPHSMAGSESLRFSNTRSARPAARCASGVWIKN